MLSSHIDNMQFTANKEAQHIAGVVPEGSPKQAHDALLQDFIDYARGKK